LGFSAVRYYNFRNLKNREVSFEGKSIFLVGKNAQGKTNTIESIYLLSYGRSFRTARNLELVRYGTRSASVEGRYDTGVEHEISVSITAQGKKRVRLDSEVIHDRGKLLDTVPCILFSHGDMDYVIGPPARRRKFFNQTQGLADFFFLDILSRYNRVLRSRNLLVQQRKYAMLDLFDRRLAGLGYTIQKTRESCITDFNAAFGPLHRRISGETADILLRYLPSWKDAGSEEDAYRHLKQSFKRDQMLKTTTTGPHRDRIFFSMGDRDYTAVASMGQLRLLALALKVSQSEYISLAAGKRPVLLLDDVLLELDSSRREAFMASLPASEQSFFAFLPEEKYLNYIGEQSLLYRVENGELTRWNGPEIS
jgi:DNA replication and repair protein RecF